MVLLKSLLSLSSLLFLNGFLATYIVRSGYDQLSLLNSRTPVEEVIKNPKTPEGIRHKLELSLDVRSFIEKKLKLNVTKNYTTYVQLDRPYVTYIVTVAEKWELKNHLYWYPFVGRMPYKGFFKLESAKEEEATFDKDKFDTMLRGVSAYSTLGWFDDPLLSSMLNGSDYNLVNTLIHESTHASLYIKNNSNFNERLAMFIGNIGTELYYRDREGNSSKTLKLIQEENEDDKIFSHFISEENRLLRKWYEDIREQRQSSNTNQKLEEHRQNKFNEIKQKFENEVASKMKTNSYKHVFDKKLNNALLLYYDLYMNDLEDLDQIYRNKFKSNFSEFFTFCKLLEKSADPLLELKNQSDAPPLKPTSPVSQ